MKAVLTILAVFALGIPAVHAFDDKALFWQVQSDTATIYLLGSIHYADESF